MHSTPSAEGMVAINCELSSTHWIIVYNRGPHLCIAVRHPVECMPGLPCACVAAAPYVAGVNSVLNNRALPAVVDAQLGENIFR